jgi:quercetin dioxygenase-like cupin family protein
MAYTASPRPTFDGPAHIPYAAVTRHLWGDSIAGEVEDWIYVSSDKIHQLVFGLPPGGWFRHSPDHRTVFAADEIYYVLGGAMTLANPQTGEVLRVLPGEAAFFRRDTWHHAYNHSAEPLRVLELFSPPPSQGTSGAYARTRPYVETARYTQDEWLSRWPMAAAERSQAATIHHLRTSDLLWRMEGTQNLVLVGIWASTEHLTVGQIELWPGQHGDVERHDGAESIYVLDGVLNVRLPEHSGQRWYELHPGDGFYLPEGTPHLYYNMSGAPARFVFGVAPCYTAGASQ